MGKASQHQGSEDQLLLAGANVFYSAVGKFNLIIKKKEMGLHYISFSVLHGTDNTSPDGRWHPAEHFLPWPLQLVKKWNSGKPWSTPFPH